MHEFNNCFPVSVIMMYLVFFDSYVRKMSLFSSKEQINFFFGKMKHKLYDYN